MQIFQIVFRVLLLFSAFLILTNNRVVEVPPIKIDQDISLRLNQLKYIEKPDFTFRNIYKREVYKVNNSTVTDFQPCSQTTPQISFDIINYYVHSDIIKKPSIIYTFQQLKSSRRILDLAYTGTHLVTISSHGGIQIMELNKSLDYQFKNLKTLKTNYKHLEMGYFVQMKDCLIFFNSDVAISINPATQQVKDIAGYQIHEKFQTVIKLNDQFVAVADRQEGIFFYLIQGNTMSKVNSFGKSNFGSLYSSPSSKLSISDLAFNSQNNKIFILDQEQGVFIFQLTFNQNKIVYSFSSSFINKKACNVMHLDIVNQFLYLSCNEISKINLKQWPVYTEKLLPHPLISIKQIITTPNNLLGLIGNNVFRLFYFDRPVDYFQDDMLDKLIFKDGIAITSNQNFIMALSYQVIPPKIICQTNNPKFLGNNQILLKTTAQCNQIYLNYIGYKPQVNITQGDVCVYTYFQNMYIWQVGPIPLTIITIIFVLMILFVIGAAFYIVVVRFRSRTAQKELQALAAESGHQVLVEQDLKQHNQQSNPNLNDQKQTQQPNKNLYSIE